MRIRFGWAAIVISVCLHLVMLGGVTLLSSWQERKNFQTSILVEVVPTPPRQEMRVVETLPAQRLESADPKAYLGARNQRTSEETVSRTVDKRLQRAHGRDSLPSQQGQILLSNLGVIFNPSSESQGAGPKEWADYSDSPEDFIKGVQEGERTLLNTKEFVFYGYFQRIREQLDRAWKPILKEQIGKLYKTGRHLASNQDHTTQTMVTLNKKGHIVRVQVVEASGTRDLDDAAVRAFNQAGPFPNPPRDLIDENGLFQIRWDFILRT